MKQDTNRKSLGQIHLIFGDDEMKRAEATWSLIDRVCPKEEQALGLETISGASNNADQAVAALKDCIEAVQTVGFLGNGKTVWLRDAEFLDAGNVAKAIAVKNTLEALLKIIAKGLADGCYLVITADKVFKGSAFYKGCVKHAEVHEFKLAAKAAQRSGDARARAAKIFRAAGVKAPSSVLEAFIDRCGSDSRQVSQEAEKLIMYLGDRSTLALDDVSTMTTVAGEAEFWELSSAVAKRDTVRAMGLLSDQLDKGGSAIGMLVGIEKTFQQLLIIRECMRAKLLSISGNSPHWSSDPESVALLDGVFAEKRQDLRRINGYRVAMLAKDAGRYSRAELRRGLKKLAVTHERMVSGSMPENILMEMLLLGITK